MIVTKTPDRREEVGAGFIGGITWWFMNLVNNYMNLATVFDWNYLVSLHFTQHWVFGMNTLAREVLSVYWGRHVKKHVIVLFVLRLWRKAETLSFTIKQTNQKRNILCIVILLFSAVALYLCVSLFPNTKNIYKLIKNKNISNEHKYLKHRKTLYRYNKKKKKK